MRNCCFILLAVLILTGCQNRVSNEQSNVGLIPEMLEVENYNNIPFLMNQRKIDSVFVIIKKGEFPRKQVNDTLNAYIRTTPNQINHQLNSVMCCSFESIFDPNGFLKKKATFSDYLTVSDYKLNVRDNKISIEDFVQEKLIDSTVYHFQQDKVLLRQDKNGTKIYEYKNGKLASTFETQTYSIEYTGAIKTDYFWNENNLEKIHLHNLKHNYSEVVLFDETNFPKYQYLIESNDTIGELLIEKF